MTGDNSTPLIIITGPTGSGKSDLAMMLAEKYSGCIVNADSRQIYIGMDIGTAKPSQTERSRIPHELFDVISPSQRYDAMSFQRDADLVISRRRNNAIIVVGGTGLYIRALLYGFFHVDAESIEHARLNLDIHRKEAGFDDAYAWLRTIDPETATRLHPNDEVRISRALEVFIATGQPLSAHHQAHKRNQPRYPYHKFALHMPRELLLARLEQRIDRMFAAGFIQEVQGLLDAGYDRRLPGMQTIGYFEIASYLAGECSLDEARERMLIATRRYAKRQMTWLRGEHDVDWVEQGDEARVLSTCDSLLAGNREALIF